MVPSLRQKFNAKFTPGKYEAFLKEMENLHPGQLDFRLAETPVFVPKNFTQKMLDACESIIDFITDDDFKTSSQKAIPPVLQVPGSEGNPQFIAFDFGVCENSEGNLEPQLIEMQGFPSLFALQSFLPEISAKHFFQPEGYSNYFNGLDKASYTALLKKIIIGDYQPQEVILLEIFPGKQKTRIDFYCHQDLVGIQPVCITEIWVEGQSVFYMNDGVKTRVKRIYNRLIFDDLQQQPVEVQEKGKILFTDLEVEWVPHPNWFYRISKYTLPFLKHPYIPSTWFLHEIKQLPADLENYVLKPLFSFAGQGVIIDLKKEDLEQIEDPENWILQKKVQYAAVIDTPDEKAKAEIRIFYFWENGAPRPKAANNLARLSKGKMVGVRYNKDKDWVGGSFCWFQQ